MPPEIVTRTVPISALTRERIADMYALFQQYYAQTSLELFTRDLRSKKWAVLLLTADEQQVVGFSSFDMYAAAADGRPIGVVYSGDTIIDRPYWGTPALPKAWIRSVLEEGQKYPSPLYWLLISSGYKTYRYLSVFYKEFFPRYDAATPRKVQELMAQLARQRFGDDYLEERGVVRFATGATPLRDGVADVHPHRLQDPHVQFFLEMNPGCMAGDELVCLAVIHPDNFTRAGQRMAA